METPLPSHDLAVSKILAHVQLIQRTYGHRILNEDSRHEIASDLALMLANGDLCKVTVELLGGTPPTQILTSFFWNLDHKLEAQTGGTDLPATAGFELPVLPAHQITAARLVVHYGADHARLLPSYKDQLKLKWGTADTLSVGAASSFQSHHIAASTRGRISGNITVTDSARRKVRVLADGVRGFSFGLDLENGINLFLHKSHLAAGAELKSGEILSCLAITTPKGIQGRDIRKA